MNDFGKTLKQLRNERGLTQKQLADRMGMSFSAISMYERGQREPDLATLGVLARFFGVTLDYFTDTEEDGIPRIPVTGMIPVYGSIPAGYPTAEASDIIDYQPVTLANPSEYFALRVRGDSMIGKGILNGSTVIIHKQDTADNGDIVACRVNGDESTLKIFSAQGGVVLLSPANPAYQPIIVPMSQFDSGEASIYGVAKQVLINV